MWKHPAESVAHSGPERYIYLWNPIHKQTAQLEWQGRHVNGDHLEDQRDLPNSWLQPC
jgi:hypothetical protein